jgi:ABC-type phosphate transport system ATPase subunit
MERHISYLLLKMDFLACKTLLSPLGAGKKTFLSTLNVMILQTVWNECVRFGIHVDIEVRYKILRLDVL